MHGWLLPVATRLGVPHIALRMLNADGREQDGKWIDGSFDRGRLDANKYGMPVLHVPSSRFHYGDGSPPSVIEVVQRISQQLKDEWPALAKGDIDPAKCDQDTPEAAREFLTDGKREAATRIVIDLGEHHQLPEVIREPGKTLPYPRHPVLLTRWSDIVAAPVGDLRDPISEQLTSGKGEVFFVKGSQRFRMEVPHTSLDGTRQFVPVDAVATNVVIFESVVSPLERMFGRLERVRAPGLRGSVSRASPDGPGLTQLLDATNKNGGPKPAIP